MQKRKYTWKPRRKPKYIHTQKKTKTTHGKKIVPIKVFYFIEQTPSINCTFLHDAQKLFPSSIRMLSSHPIDAHTHTHTRLVLNIYRSAFYLPRFLSTQRFVFNFSLMWLCVCVCVSQSSIHPFNDFHMEHFRGPFQTFIIESSKFQSCETFSNRCNQCYKFRALNLTL